MNPLYIFRVIFQSSCHDIQCRLHKIALTLLYMFPNEYCRHVLFVVADVFFMHVFILVPFHAEHAELRRKNKTDPSRSGDIFIK